MRSSAYHLDRVTKDIISCLREPLLLLDAELNIQAISPEFCRLINTTEEQILGHSLLSVSNLGIDRAGLKEDLLAVLEKGESVSRRLHKNKNVNQISHSESVLVLTAHYTELAGDAPAIVVIISRRSRIDAIGLDRHNQNLINNQQEVEFSLSDTQWLLQDYPSQNLDWLWQTDAELRFNWFSPTLSGWMKEQITADIYGKTRAELVPAEDIGSEHWQQHLQTLAKRQPFHNFEYDMQAADGWHRIRTSGVPIYTADDEFAGYHGIATNITELYQAREQNQIIQQRFLQAIELLSEGIAYFDTDERLIMCNQNFRSAYIIGEQIRPGITFSEILQLYLKQGVVKEAIGREQEWFEWRLQQFRNSQQAFDISLSNDRWILIDHQRLSDGGTLLIRVDISELEKAKQQAEQASQAKSRFLAAASHDLRQPLLAIRLLADLLQEQLPNLNSPEQAINALRELLNAVSSMEALINSYLSLNKLESGRIEPQLTTVVIAELLQSIIQELAPQAQNKGIALRVVACSQSVISDSVLLNQIVKNLVSNAIRYTQGGRVVLGCRRRGRYLSIEVWDSGIGIADDQLDKIFEEFYQIDHPMRQQHTGQGLGLAIVKYAANLLQHEISVQSVPGKGSKFALRVPLADAQQSLSTPESKIKTALPVSEPATSTEYASADHSSVSILLIEDDDNVRRSLEMLLTQKEFSVISAINGEQALALLDARDIVPRLVLTDYQLPGTLSGRVWLRTLRDRLGKDIPIIILTGAITVDFGTEVDVFDCQVIIKPVSSTKLLAIIRDHLN